MRSDQKRNSRKTSEFNMTMFLLVIFLLVSGILIAQIYFQKREGGAGSKLSPTPAVTGCLGIAYENKNNGYKVCMPRGWTYKEFGAGKETVGFDERTIPSATNYLGRFIVRVADRNINEELLSYEGLLSGKKAGEMVVDGVTGKRIEGIISSPSIYSFYNGQQEMVVLIERSGGSAKQNSRVFEISFSNTADRYIAQLPMFLDFLEGFKFIEASPSFVTSPEGNITVTTPLPNSIVSSPITVRGKARVFENTVSIRLEDAFDGVLSRSTAYIKPGETGSPGDFEATLQFSSPVPPAEGVLKVLAVSPKEGSETDIVEIPLRFR